MKLIVGLGNPGRKYQGTRHNIGFEVVTEFAKRCLANPFRSKFNGEVSDVRVQGHATLLLMPTTYMNLSGSSVLAAKDFHKIQPSDVLVICDDFNLSLAQLRFRSRGSAGGQKGLADVIRRLGTQEIPRLRFGIGTPPPRWDVADYVLSKFRDDEQVDLAIAVDTSVRAVEDWIVHGTEHCMNSYNANQRNSGE